MNGRNIKTLYAAHRVHSRVAYGYQNKQQLFLVNSNCRLVVITKMERIYCAVRSQATVRFLVDKFALV